METKTKITKGSYGNYSSSNYGAHSLVISIGKLSLWFSYDTVIAFEDGGQDIQVSENNWGPTTGKHLNILDGGNKKTRLDSAVFEHNLEAVLAKYNLVT